MCWQELLMRRQLRRMVMRRKKDVAKPSVKQEVNCFSSFLELPHKQKNDKSAVPLLFLQLPCPAV